MRIGVFTFVSHQFVEHIALPAANIRTALRALTKVVASPPFIIFLITAEALFWNQVRSFPMVK